MVAVPKSPSRSEIDFIVEGCLDNCRTDGRTQQQTREYTIELGASSSSVEASPLPLVNGSARLHSVAGETDILCSVKVELAHPALDSPTMGRLDIHVEDLRTARNEEVATLLSNLVLSRGDGLDQLCIVPHFYVWKVSIDLLIISSSGGSTIDLCSCLIRATLAHSQLPRIEALPSDSGAKPALQVDSDSRKASPLPIHIFPEIITVAVLRRVATHAATKASDNNASKSKATTALIVDATAEEDACAFARIHVAIDRSNEDAPSIVSLQKTGKGALQPAIMQDVTTLALGTKLRIHHVSKRVDECLGGRQLLLNY